MTLKPISGAVALSLCAIALPASSQDTGAMLCHYAGEAYSIGATKRFGSAAYACTAAADGQYGVWSELPAEGSSTNCVFADQEYGHGSLVLVDLEYRVCSRGIWYAWPSE